MKAKKRVLVCPLDWGLGHATRCIPIIRSLRAYGCEVLIASSGDALVLLKIEFPELIFFTLTGYSPDYKGNSFLVSMFRQLPKFRSVIRREEEEVFEIVKQHSVDIIISDNRYGCWSDEVKSVIITHQLNIQLPFLSKLVRSLHRNALRKFNEVWVPDVEGSDSLAGNLSHSDGFPVTYIGPLSRMLPGVHQKKYDIVAVISGPEPQRTTLEDLLRDQLVATGGKTLLVKGKPSSRDEVLSENTTEINFLPALALNDVLAGASLVICRSGYSTLMDLQVLGSRAILIPTPGQTEQEYLAAELMKKGIALSVTQDKLNLTQDIPNSEKYSGFKANHSHNLLDRAIQDLLA